jgi:hypothetical protein
LSAKLVPTFLRIEGPRGQRVGSLRPYSRFPRPGMYCYRLQIDWDYKKISKRLSNNRISCVQCVRIGFLAFLYQACRCEIPVFARSGSSAVAKSEGAAVRFTKLSRLSRKVITLRQVSTRRTGRSPDVDTGQSAIFFSN